MVCSSPAIGSDGTVYVGSRDRKLYAVNDKSGAKLWEIETGGGGLAHPPSDRMARFTLGHWTTCSMHSMARLGCKLWEFETGNFVTSSPAIGRDGTVYFGSWDNKLYALNSKTGTKLWEFETGNDVRSSPAIGA